MTSEFAFTVSRTGGGVPSREQGELDTRLHAAPGFAVPSCALGSLSLSRFPSERQAQMALRKHTRQAVFERDDYCCRYCGERITELRRWHHGAHRWVGLIHVDHVVPRCKGGTDELDNLVTACRDCNLAKYDNEWNPLALELVA